MSGLRRVDRTPRLVVFFGALAVVQMVFIAMLSITVMRLMASCDPQAATSPAEADRPPLSHFQALTARTQAAAAAAAAAKQRGGAAEPQAAQRPQKPAGLPHAQAADGSPSPPAAEAVPAEAADGDIKVVRLNEMLPVGNADTLRYETAERLLELQWRLSTPMLQPTMPVPLVQPWANYTQSQGQPPRTSYHMCMLAPVFAGSACDSADIADIPLVSLLLSSVIEHLERGAPPLAIIVGHDHSDAAFWEDPDCADTLARVITTMLDNAEAIRPQTGPAPEIFVQHLRIHSPLAGNPVWAWNQLALYAVQVMGCRYLWQVNDDTRFMSGPLIKPMITALKVGFLPRGSCHHYGCYLSHSLVFFFPRDELYPGQSFDDYGIAAPVDMNSTLATLAVVAARHVVDLGYFYPHHFRNW